MTITIKNGHNNINGANWRVCVNASWAFSRPTKLAKVTVGIPIEPNGVGTPLAIRQTKQENKENTEKTKVEDKIKKQINETYALGEKGLIYDLKKERKQT